MTKNPKLGKDANRAKHILIYDDQNILQYDCNGTFCQLCNAKVLSYHLFYKSLKTGAPINSKNSKFHGWYAVSLDR